MAAPSPVEPTFLTRPFTVAEFTASGYSAKLLRSRRFIRCHPRVWVSARHVMSPGDRREAARLALPCQARMTDITRIQDLGLDFGDPSPLHFVVDHDLHIDIEGIMLHRTAAMPPSDGRAVTPAAAFVAYCSHARVIDAIGVGDWLLHWRHMTVSEVADLVASQPWRNGAAQARRVIPSLTARSRSIPESQLRVIFGASGITGLEVNAPFETPGGRPLEIDLLVRDCQFAIEYEGTHHQSDRGQYLKDIDRHGLFREAGLHYTLVTKEHMHYPRSVVLSIHRRLLERGYDGPPPDFGQRWHAAFAAIRPARR